MLVIHQSSQSIYVWINENPVKIAAKLFACQAVVMLKNLGVLGQRAQVRGHQLILHPRGWVTDREAFLVVKLDIFFAGQPWLTVPCRLRGRQPASHTQARWVSRLCSKACSNRLSVID